MPRDKTKQISFAVTNEFHREVRILSAKTDTSVKALFMNAFESSKDKLTEVKNNG